MGLTPGTRLGAYEIVGLLGWGFEAVYRARDTRVDRHVALRVQPRPFASDPERIARFQHEAKLLASLNHPHIALLVVEEHDGRHFLAMELGTGEILAARIARGPIPVDEALPIARQIAEALEAAHEQGTIHGDLTPANIEVRPDGVVRVHNFGLAKLWARDDGLNFGNLAYTSPEQTNG